MTTIITRLYADPAAARAAVEDLMRQGHSNDYINIITRDGDGPVPARMQEARVNARSAAAYAPHVEAGAALVVVQAPFNPMGAARHAMRVLDRHPSVNAGVANENEYIRETPQIERSGKIMADHPRFMSHDMAARSRGLTSTAFGLPLLSAPKPRTSAMAGGGYMSSKLLPFPLLSQAKDRGSVIRGGWTMSGMFGIPMISRR